MAIDGLSKKVDENSAEHIMIRNEIAAVKADMLAMKAIDPDKKITEYMNSSRAWRMVIVGQAVALLILIGSAIWNFSALTSMVASLHDNQVKNLHDVEDIKMTCTGYRDFKIKSNSLAGAIK